MLHAALSVALLAALTAASPQAGNGGSSDDEARVDALCRPPNSTAVPRPPCHVIADLGYICKANGTSPLALDAHAQCMCKGSYFADYVACQSCKRVHGVASPADEAHFSAVIGSVSRALCSGTPTADLDGIFNSVSAAMTAAPTGNTAKSDSGGGRTDVSVYATITYSQGPGRIEGGATAATTRETSSPPSGSTTSSRTRANDGAGGGGGGGGTTAAGAATTATTSSPNGAVPTAGFGGVAVGLAAGAFMAAL
ncbi:hypothetical protein RB594_005845 [Gaeumannomyces avenae]